MSIAYRRGFSLALVLAVSVAATAAAQDWPQWRGPSRDGRATGFKAPDSWPKELTQKWKVDVGDGVATPALFGDRLYVFSREGGDEIIRCLNVADGKELWQEKYASKGVSGRAGSFSGPRCSPTVSEGKVVTLGVQGVLSCYEAEGGKQLWSKQPFDGEIPIFAVASSPIVVDGLCIAQLGGRSNGGMAAFDLTSGEEKWKWTGDEPAYGSPTLIKVAAMKAIVAPTTKKMVALAATDGKPLWEQSYQQGGRYNAASPIVEGETLIIAGPTSGITAKKIAAEGEMLAMEELWKNRDNSVQFNTPVVREGHLYGLSKLNSLFCINLASGETAWNAPLSGKSSGDQPAAGQGREGGVRPARGESGDRPPRREGAPREGGDRPPRGEGAPREGGDRAQPDRGGRGSGRGFGRVGRGGRGGFGGGGGRGGYGSVVDAGSAMFALSPAGQLVVFAPSTDEFKQLASYKVASDGKTYAYPVVSGNRVIIKDGDSVTLWTIE